MTMQYNLIAFQAHHEWIDEVIKNPLIQKVPCESFDAAIAEINKAHLEDSDDTLALKAEIWRENYKEEYDEGKSIEVFFIFRRLYEAALEHRKARKDRIITMISEVEGYVEITIDPVPVQDYFYVRLMFQSDQEEVYQTPQEIGMWSHETYDEAFKTYKMVLENLDYHMCFMNKDVGFYDVYRYLVEFAWKINDILEEAKKTELEKKVNQGLAEIAQYKILSEAIQKIQDVAEDLYDTSEEELANRLYLAVIDMVKGENMLAQYVQARVMEEVNDRNIKMTDKQISDAVSRAEVWVLDNLRGNIQDAVKDALWSGTHEPTHTS